MFSGSPDISLFGTFPTEETASAAAGSFSPWQLESTSPPADGQSGFDNQLLLEYGASDAPAGRDLAHTVQTAPPGYQLLKPARLSLTQLLSLGSSVLGWKVLVESSDGSYVGYVCWLLNHCSRLGLEEVSRPSTGVRRVGLVLLYYRSITSVTLIAKRQHDPRKAAKQKSNVLEETRGRSLLMKKLVPPHLVDKRITEEIEEESDEDHPSVATPPLPPPPGRLSRPDYFVVVDALGQRYTDAVRDISSQERVGLSVNGHKVGRWGALAWVCVATPYTVYLFDAATMGTDQLFKGQQPLTTKKKRKSQVKLPTETNNESKLDSESWEKTCFVGENQTTRIETKNETNVNEHSGLQLGENNCNNEPDISIGDVVPGETMKQTLVKEISITDEHQTLKDIPVSSSIGDEQRSAVISSDDDNDICLGEVLTDSLLEIVTHDARNLCDLLHHQLGLHISGLFDTQACELYLHMLLNRGDCPAFVPSLSSLLLRHLQLAPQHLLYEKLERRQQGDSSAYFERPVSERTLSGLASRALFLCELQHVQLTRVLVDLSQLTTVHSEAHMLKDDVTRGRVEQFVVPDSVQKLGRRTVLRTNTNSRGTAWGGMRPRPSGHRQAY